LCHRGWLFSGYFLVIFVLFLCHRGWFIVIVFDRFPAFMVIVPVLAMPELFAAIYIQMVSAPAPEDLFIVSHDADEVADQDVFVLIFREELFADLFTMFQFDQSVDRVAAGVDTPAGWFMVIVFDLSPADINIVPVLYAPVLAAILIDKLPLPVPDVLLIVIQDAFDCTVQDVLVLMLRGELLAFGETMFQFDQSVDKVAACTGAAAGWLMVIVFDSFPPVIDIVPVLAAPALAVMLIDKLPLPVPDVLLIVIQDAFDLAVQDVLVLILRGELLAFGETMFQFDQSVVRMSSGAVCAGAPAGWFMVIGFCRFPAVIVMIPVLAAPLLASMLIDKLPLPVPDVLLIVSQDVFDLAVQDVFVVILRGELLAFGETMFQFDQSVDKFVGSGTRFCAVSVEKFMSL